MRTVVLASVRVYARRYVAAVLAVVLGVGFVVVTATIASATRSGILSGLSASYRGADVVVTDVSPDAADRALTRLRGVGPASVNGEATTTLTRRGVQLADDARIGSVSTQPSLRWQRADTGRIPRGSGEALADAAQAEGLGVRVGDRVVVGTGDQATTVRVVGLTRTAGSLSAGLYLTWPDLSKLGDQLFVSNLVVGGASVGDVRAAGLPRYAKAVPAFDFLQEQAKAQTRGVDVVSVMLLLFGAIAFFVSILVIANTFTVLLAQRMRDFALLRCVGATRRQVMRSVRREALIIGVGAATLGLVVGLLGGRLLVWVAGRVFSSLSLGAVHVDWRWLTVAWLVGVGVTLVASVAPARRSTRIEPLAALRPMEDVPVRTRAGIARLALGTVLELAGVMLLAFAMLAHQPFVMIIGGFLSFFGLLAFGPVLVPACIRVAGVLTGRLLGVPGRLGAANAVRNPRRTAATAASLLVGTTLVTGMLVGMATIRNAVDTAMDRDHPLDVALVADRPLPAGTGRRVAGIDGIAAAVALKGTTADVAGKGLAAAPTTVLAAPRAGIVHGKPGWDTPLAGEIYLPWAVMNQLTDQAHVTVSEAGRSFRLRPVGAEGLDGTAGVVSAATLDRLAGPDATTRAVWARASDRIDADRTTATVNTLAASVGAVPSTSLKQRAYVDLQLDVMLYSVLTLLSVALVIALLGIGSTLGLSVLERGREHALLRALGLTRGQLRATLTVEAVLLAAVTSVIGVVVGSAYALVGVRTLLDRAVGSEAIHLTLPVGQLLLVVLIAALAGVGACVLPARRAARVAPAAGLAVE